MALTSLAEERTLLANERTFLAYSRTALAFFALGALLPRISNSLYVTELSFFSLFFGIALFVFGFNRFVTIRARILHVAPWKKSYFFSTFRSFFMGLFLRKP